MTVSQYISVGYCCWDCYNKLTGWHSLNRSSLTQCHNDFFMREGDLVVSVTQQLMFMISVEGKAMLNTGDYE